MRTWPAAMEQWKPLIQASSTLYGLEPSWLAAIMATESGGTPGLCARLADHTCAQNEGAGLMAILPSTAALFAGRRVTSEELMANNEFSIELGAKILRALIDKNQSDFVMAAIAYNAGSVKCGRGRVWRPAGSDLPRDPCPPTSWGVVMGCVESPPGSGKIVVNDYPERAIEFANAAADHGFSGVLPPTIAVASMGSGFEWRSAVMLGFGAAAGWWTTKKARRG